VGETKMNLVNFMLLAMGALVGVGFVHIDIHSFTGLTTEQENAIVKEAETYTPE